MNQLLVFFKIFMYSLQRFFTEKRLLWAASLTYTYLYMSGMGTPAGAGTQTLPFPSGLRLTAGCSIRVWDVNNIDAAADDMTTVVSYVEYDA